VILADSGAASDMGRARQVKDRPQLRNEDWEIRFPSLARDSSTRCRRRAAVGFGKPIARFRRPSPSGVTPPREGQSTREEQGARIRSVGAPRVEIALRYRRRPTSRPRRPKALQVGSASALFYLPFAYP